MKCSTRKFFFISALAILCFSGCKQVEPVHAIVAATQPTLIADCVVNYYKLNSSSYITQQKHRFTPSAGRLSISADEPAGSYKYILDKQVFTSSKSISAQLSDLPESFFNQSMATAIFYSMCAGGDLINTANMQTGEAYKVQGQWYTPLTPSWPSEPYSVTLLKDNGSSKIQLVSITNASNGIIWMARNYNLRYNNSLQRVLPRTIDIFDVRDGIGSKRLIAKFEYKDIRLSNESSDQNSD